MTVGLRARRYTDAQIEDMIHDKRTELYRDLDSIKVNLEGDESGDESYDDDSEDEHQKIDPEKLLITRGFDACHVAKACEPYAMSC